MPLVKQNYPTDRANEEVSNISTTYSSVKKSNRRFSTETTTSEIVEENDDRRIQGSKNKFDSIQNEAYTTKEYPTDRHHPANLRDSTFNTNIQTSTSQRSPNSNIKENQPRSPSKNVLDDNVTIAGTTQTFKNIHINRADERDYFTDVNPNEIIHHIPATERGSGYPDHYPIQSKPDVRSNRVETEFSNKFDKRFGTEHTITTEKNYQDDYNTNNRQDFSTHGYPSAVSRNEHSPEPINHYNNKYSNTQSPNYVHPSKEIPTNSGPSKSVPLIKKSPTSKTTTSAEAAKVLLQKEREVDSAHRAFAASLRSDSPSESRHDMPRYSPRSSISSTKTYRRDSAAPSEASKYSSSTVTRPLVKNTVNKNTTKSSNIRNQNVSVSSETVDLTPQRVVKSPVNKNVTTRTTITRKIQTEVPKPDNQLTSPEDYKFLINEPLTITKSKFSSNDASFQGNEVVEEPCLKKNFYQLGPFDRSYQSSNVPAVIEKQIEQKVSEPQTNGRRINKTLNTDIVGTKNIPKDTSPSSVFQKTIDRTKVPEGKNTLNQSRVNYPKSQGRQKPQEKPMFPTNPKSPQNRTVRKGDLPSKTTVDSSDSEEEVSDKKPNDSYVPHNAPRQYDNLEKTSGQFKRNDISHSEEELSENDEILNLVPKNSDRIDCTQVQWIEVDEDDNSHEENTKNTNRVKSDKFPTARNVKNPETRNNRNGEPEDTLISNLLMKKQKDKQNFTKKINEEFILNEKVEPFSKLDEKPDGAFLSTSHPKTPAVPTYKKKGSTDRETFDERCRNILGMEEYGNTQGQYRKHADIKEAQKPQKTETTRNEIPESEDDEVMKTKNVSKFDDTTDDEHQIDTYTELKINLTKKPIEDNKQPSNSKILTKENCDSPTKGTDQTIYRTETQTTSTRKSVDRDSPSREIEHDSYTIGSQTSEKYLPHFVPSTSPKKSVEHDSHKNDIGAMPNEKHLPQFVQPTSARKSVDRDSPTKEIDQTTYTTETCSTEEFSSPVGQSTYPRKSVDRDSPTRSIDRTSYKIDTQRTEKPLAPSTSPRKSVDRDSPTRSIDRTSYKIDTQTTEKHLAPSTSPRKSIDRDSPTKEVERTSYRIETQTTGKHSPRSTSPRKSVDRDSPTKEIDHTSYRIETHKTHVVQPTSTKKSVDRDSPTKGIDRTSYRIETVTTEKNIPFVAPSTSPRKSVDRDSAANYINNTPKDKMSPHVAQPSSPRKSVDCKTPTKGVERTSYRIQTQTKEKSSPHVDQLSSPRKSIDRNSPTKGVGTYKIETKPTGKPLAQNVSSAPSRKSIDHDSPTKGIHRTTYTIETKTTGKHLPHTVNTTRKPLGEEPKSFNLVKKDNILNNKNRQITNKQPFQMTKEQNKSQKFKETPNESDHRPRSHIPAEGNTKSLISEFSSETDNKRPSVKKDLSKTNKIVKTPISESTPRRDNERRRSSNISVCTEIVIEHTPSSKEVVDKPSHKPSRKIPVTERKESAPVKRVTQEDHNSKMSRSTSESLIEVNKTPRKKPAENSPMSTSAKLSPHATKRKTTKTINLMADNDFENIVIDMQLAKSSREPSPDRIVPTPVPANLDTGKPRYPDVVQEPDDEPRKKPVVTNIPIFEEESNDFVRCHISEINIEKELPENGDIQDGYLSNPIVEAPISLECEFIEKTDVEKSSNVSEKVTKFTNFTDQEKKSKTPSFSKKPVEVSDVNTKEDDYLLNVNEKVSKFSRLADQEAKTKTPAVFNNMIKLSYTKPETDSCPSTVDEKLSKFIKTERETSNFVTSKDKQIIDQSSPTNENKINRKPTNSAEKIGVLTPQKAPQLVARIERTISRQNETDNEDKNDTEELIPFSRDHTTEIEIKRQKDILNRPSLWEKPSSTIKTKNDKDIDWKNHSENNLTHTSSEIQVLSEKNNKLESNTDNNQKLNKKREPSPTHKNSSRTSTTEKDETYVIEHQFSNEHPFPKSHTTKEQPSPTVSKPKSRSSPEPKHYSQNTEIVLKRQPTAEICDKSIIKQNEDLTISQSSSIQKDMQNLKHQPSYMVHTECSLQHSRRNSPDVNRSITSYDNLKHLKNSNNIDDDLKIEEIFDIEILNHLLETVNSYELRKVIRAQIRLVKSASMDLQNVHNSNSNAPSPRRNSADIKKSIKNYDHQKQLNSLPDDMEIEDIFDIEVLNKLLETVNIYEIKKRIRAQIRLVKLKTNDSQNVPHYATSIVPHTRRPSDKNIIKNQHDEFEEVDIEKIFDIEILNQMLETAKTYEIKKKIRAQIRLIKLKTTDFQNIQTVPHYATSIVPHTRRDSSDANKNIMKNQHNKPEDVEIEKIFDIEILQQLLETASTYELKKKIRAQIRLVKTKYTESNSNSFDVKCSTTTTVQPNRRDSSEMKKNITMHENKKRIGKLNIEVDDLDIEEIFDIDILNQLLETVDSYELRKRIRAQIRLVKSKEIEVRNLQHSSTNKQQKITTSELDSSTIPHKESPRTVSPKITKTEKKFSIESPVKIKIDSITTSNKNENTNGTPSKNTKKPGDVKVSISQTSTVTRQQNKEPIWANRKNILKNSSVTNSSKSPTSTKTHHSTSTTRTITSNKSLSKKSEEEDCITSSYGIGPTDEQGLPLFGIKALRKKNSTPSNESKKESSDHVMEKKCCCDHNCDHNCKHIIEPEREGSFSELSEDEMRISDEKELQTIETSYSKSTRGSGIDSSISKKFTSKTVQLNVDNSGGEGDNADNYVRTKKTKKLNVSSTKDDLFGNEYFIEKESNSYDRSVDEDRADQRESNKKHSSSSTTVRSFLNSSNDSKVAHSIDDVLVRMQNADFVIEEGDTAEDQEARALLNKFLGASVIMTGVENSLPMMTTQTKSSQQLGIGQNNQNKKTVRNVKKVENSSSSVSGTTCEIEEIQDEKVLKLLLDQATTYEERRKIRAHLRELMSDPTDLITTSTTETTESNEKDGDTTTATKVTTRSVTTVTAPKRISPFAKFKELDRQNSINSPKSPSTPTTPGSASASPSSSTPIFKFTDPALNARAATVKDQLLQWCQMKTEEYENVQITNFSSCWTDGLAFCALIHHFLPDAFDYTKLTPQNRRHNFELAFTVADEKAGIAPLLDVEDMVVMKRPDWKCVFVYVQSIYRRFRNCQ